MAGSQVSKVIVFQHTLWRLTMTRQHPTPCGAALHRKAPPRSSDRVSRALSPAAAHGSQHTRKGYPRRWAVSSSSLAIRSPVMKLSTMAARRSRVKSSMTQKHAEAPTVHSGCRMRSPPTSADRPPAGSSSAPGSQASRLRPPRFCAPSTVPPLVEPVELLAVHHHAFPHQAVGADAVQAPIPEPTAFRRKLPQPLS